MCWYTCMWLSLCTENVWKKPFLSSSSAKGKKVECILKGSFLQFAELDSQAKGKGHMILGFATVEKSNKYACHRTTQAKFSE